MRPVEELIKEFSGENSDVLMLLRETAGLVAFYRRLLERFELDALTGLPGSNKFRDYIDNLKINQSGFGVIFFDVNDLKYYNDNIGHQAGDLLLQKAAESLHAICAVNVRAFRVGGDEFVVVVTGCEESAIDGILAAWRKKLEELNTADDGIHCSIAVGAAYGDNDCEVSDILKLADERMYDEKRRMKSAPQNK